jgi:hypothetical protein
LKDRGFLLVIAVGLLARACIAASGYVPPHDPTYYMTLAQHVRDGSGLWVDSATYGSNLRALFPPVYPLLLSLFGVSAHSVAALNAAFDVGTACLIYRLSNRNLIAAAIFFLWPTVILNSVVAQKESLTMLLVAALLSLRRVSTFGLCGGLLILTQPALLLLPLALAVKQGWKYAITAVLFMALAMSPWIIRNWFVFERFIPLTTSAGFSLAYVANGARHIAPSPEILALPEHARSMAVWREALAAIVAEPLSYLRQVMSDAGRAMLFDTFSVQRLRPVVGWSIAVPVQALHLLLLVVAAFGIDRKCRWVLVAAGIAMLPMMAFEFGERHRYFLYPILAVLAAKALSRFLRKEQGVQPVVPA